METLAILFTFLSILVGIIPYLENRLTELLGEFNFQLLMFCQKLKRQTDDELIASMKPYVLGTSIFMVLLASLLMQLWGENDQDVIQVGFIWFFLIAFFFFAMTPRQEFIKKFQIISQKYIALYRNLLFTFIGISVAYFLLLKTLDPNIPDQDFQYAILDIFKWVSIPAFLFWLMFILMLVGLPFFSRALFIIGVRKMVKLIIKKEPRNPIKIPLLFLSSLFLLFAIYSHLIEKLSL